MKYISSSIGFVFLLLSFAAFQPSSAQQKTTKPNVLFLFADDQRADAIGAAGNPYIQTPNLDRLASEGSRFANAYVMGGNHGAVCAASRAVCCQFNAVNAEVKMIGQISLLYFLKLTDKISMALYNRFRAERTFLNCIVSAISLYDRPS